MGSSDKVAAFPNLAMKMLRCNNFLQRNMKKLLVKAQIHTIAAANRLKAGVLEPVAAKADHRFRGSQQARHESGAVC